MQTERISQYDIIRQLRLPLIVLVTYAHSYGGVTEGYSVLGSGWDTYELLRLLVSQTLVKVAMPAFFVISGYLFFANVETFSREVYWQKIRRRIKTLLIPYLVWNLLMAAKLRTFSLGIFWEPANMPLWFLRDLMVVSLLTPIIYIGVRKLGWWIFAILLPVYLTGVWAVQPGFNPYAICFFTLGACLSIRKMNLLDTCVRFEKPCYILSALMGLGMVLSYGSGFFAWLMLGFRLTGMVAVFCLGRHIYVHWSYPLKYDASYFIYLSHYVLFFSFIDTAFFWFFGTTTASLCLHYLLCPLLKVCLLIAIYHVYKTIQQDIM
jgi:surface polysaccharide O-acyltransferase-like enzyme